MRLKELHIRDFKRFADLTISDIPESAKLVILTGPNGSGKTSLFEAFNYWMNFLRKEYTFEAEYYLRISGTGTSDASMILQRIDLQFHGMNNVRNDQERKRKVFYIRSAYRHEPDFAIQNLSAIDDVLNDSRRPQRLINSEQRVSDNYQRMVGEAIRALYSDDPVAQQKTVKDVADELIGEAREAMRKIFDDLELQGLGNPMDKGTFRFKKGTSSGFHYKNLSGGEKAAFDLLLDFVVKRRAFDDTVFCIDEPELHMHTKLQARLLEVMFSLVPDNCQLWLSTHSIGMMRMAAQLKASHPDQVAFIDFHHQEFDQPTTLQPVTPDRRFWQQMFHTALDDLAHLVVPKHIVFCEGKRLGQGGQKPSFDAEVYKTIFSPHYHDVDFAPLGGTKEVEKNGKEYGILLNTLAPGIKFWRVFDLDDRHSDEVQKLKAEGIQVLGRRDIESYLWDDEVLEALCTQYDSPEKLSEILDEKEQALKNIVANRQPKDDIKAISGHLYNKCRQTLGLTQCGNTSEEFARLTLSLLIKPGMKVYEELDAIVMALHETKIK
ncbi:AAA family ATPase [Verminephrobacter eiseniae]|uniref:AAA family ATPase n=1 Tax=Verminephrobacter eiseniae TaxID=364317 RepID=UPI0022377043|nr:ATP-binding protein [Verminephrobacter eiseniae]